MLEGVLLETEIGEAVGFRDGSRIQKPQVAAHWFSIIIFVLGSEVEQKSVIILQYTIESAHVGSKVGTTVGSGEGCLEELADGEIDGEAVGLIVLLLQVSQDTGQSLWISFLVS